MCLWSIKSASVQSPTVSCRWFCVEDGLNKSKSFCLLVNGQVYIYITSVLCISLEYRLLCWLFVDGSMIFDDHIWQLLWPLLLWSSGVCGISLLLVFVLTVIIVFYFTSFHLLIAIKLLLCLTFVQNSLCNKHFSDLIFYCLNIFSKILSWTEIVSQLPEEMIVEWIAVKSFMGTLVKSLCEKKDFHDAIFKLSLSLLLPNRFPLILIFQVCLFSLIWHSFVSRHVLLLLSLTGVCLPSKEHLVVICDFSITAKTFSSVRNSVKNNH